MLFVQLELTLLCRGCHAPIALNAVTLAVDCDRCLRTAQVDADDWRGILQGALREAEGMLENEERDLPYEGAVGRVRRIVRRAAPRCSACRTPLAAEHAMALPDGGRMACSACGRPATRRRVPFLAGTSFLGEDVTLLEGRREVAQEPVPLPCGSCGASLQVDGQQRVVVCRYCGAASHLPDAVWARLHPLRPVVPFFALLDHTAGVGPTRRSELTWSSVSDVVADDAGNLYLAGTVPSLTDAALVEEAVWSCDPEGRLRWLRRETSAERLALFGGERLIVWDHMDPEPLACDDGRSLGPPFPLSGGDVRRFFQDADGTILRMALTEISRHAPTGEAIPRHPDASDGFFAQVGALFSGDALSDRAWGMTGALLRDGSIAALVSERGGDRDVVELLVVDGRTGAVHIRRTVEIDHAALHAGRLQSDGQGRVLFFDDQRAQICCLDAQGTSVILAGTFLDRSSRLAVLASGEMWVVSDEGAARRLAADGRLLHANEAARRADREAALPSR